MNGTIEYAPAVMWLGLVGLSMGLAALVSLARLRGPR